MLEYDIVDVSEGTDVNMLLFAITGTLLNFDKL